MNGGDAHPLYKYMRNSQPKSLPRGQNPSVGEKGRIEWNYVKFLIDRNGNPVRRYAPSYNPRSFEADVSVMHVKSFLQHEKKWLLPLPHFWRGGMGLAFLCMIV